MEGKEKKDTATNQKGVTHDMGFTPVGYVINHASSFKRIRNVISNSFLLFCLRNLYCEAYDNVNHCMDKVIYNTNVLPPHSYPTYSLNIT